MPAGGSASCSRGAATRWHAWPSDARAPSVAGRARWRGRRRSARRLAAEGVTFEEVYSQSPKTTPSHMTLLTSLYPSVHGIEMWQEGTPGRVLNPRVHTLAEVLKDAGYATAAFTGGANLDRSRGFN